MSAHPAVAILERAAATLASDAGAGVDAVEVRLRPGDAAPTRAELEAALGPAHELPRIPGPAFRRLASAAPAGGTPVTLIAELDDETGRATALLARRDEI